MIGVPKIQQAIPHRNLTLQKPEGKQHGEIEPIFWIHYLRYPKNGDISMILSEITAY